MDELPEDLPPLEDMSHVLQATTPAESKGEGVVHRLQPEPEAESGSKKEESKTKAEDSKKSKSKEGFGGFSKGFLTSAPKAKKKNKEMEDLRHIKASGEDQLKIDEVQNAMKDNPALKPQNWMNKDIIEKVAQSPKLMAAMQNPEILQAIDMMGKNPQKAMELYGKNPEFKEIMMEFAGLMGTHFEGLGQVKAQDDPAMEAINKDPEVQAILADPEVMAVIQKMQKSGGMELNSFMKENPRVAQKLQILMRKKVLNVQQTP